MKEPDLGSAMVLAIVVLAVLVAGGVKKRHLAVVFGLGITAVTFLALAEPYRRTRMLTFLDPFADAKQHRLPDLAVADRARQRRASPAWGSVPAGRSGTSCPNAHTDFIFAIIGEELGLIGCFLVMGLFIAFAVLGARAALRAPDRFGSLIAAGATVWVVGQAVINIGAVVGLLPVTGIPLPFVSFGGSALITTMLATGILVNVARQGRTPSHGASRTAPRSSARTGPRPAARR